MRRLLGCLLLFLIIFIGAEDSLLASGFIYPVGNPLNGQGYTITQEFNTTWDEGFWLEEIRYYGHTGVDLANGEEGGLIRASAAGRVVASGYSGGEIESGLSICCLQGILCTHSMPICGIPL